MRKSTRGINRLWATILSIVFFIGILPLEVLTAQAAEPSNRQTVDESTVSVEYLTPDRSQARIKYHKEGVQPEAVNMVFLVDLSKQGAQANEVFQKMLHDSGVDYIFNSRAASTAYVIGYQNDIVKDSGIVKDGYVADALFTTSDIVGKGIARESVGLKKAIEVVNKMHTDNSNKTVVFWVTGEKLTEDSSIIEENLKQLKSTLRNDDALITWQLADKPNELLMRYATTHDTPYGEGKSNEANAEKDKVIMQQMMTNSMEKICHDHYRDVRFELRLSDAQTLVKKINKAYYEASGSSVNMDATLSADGKSVGVVFNTVCRKIDIDFILEVELDANRYEKQTVIDGGVISVGANSYNGRLQTGLFDETVVRDLGLSFPAVELDRLQYAIAFYSSKLSHMPMPIKKIAGETVTLPIGEDINLEGYSFGGWNVTGGANQGQHYAPGEIISMPEGDMKMEPAFGRIDVDLEIDYEQGEPVVIGNQMAGDRDTTSMDMPATLDFTGAKINGQAIKISDVRSVSFINQHVDYDTINDAEDPYKVKMNGESEVAYARHVGKTENDKVVAYLMPSRDVHGKYDMYVAGEGGVKAPKTAEVFQTKVIERGVGWTYYLEKIDVTGLDISGRTDIRKMFANCGNLTDIKGLETWNTEQITDMSELFVECKKLKQIPGIENWNTQNVTNMSKMFYKCEALTSIPNIKDWNVGQVKNTSNMFNGCTALTNLDLSNWQLAAVNMGSMFNSCIRLTAVGDISGWDFSKVTDMNHLFASCSELKSLDVSSWDVQNVTDMSGVFWNCSTLPELNVTNWNTANVQNMSGIFNGCTEIRVLDVSRWNTGSVTDMGEMFSRCPRIDVLDLTNWDTGSVTNMAKMFDGCRMLNEIRGIENFKTHNVRDMQYMFSYCHKIAALDLSSWDTSSLTNTKNMFQMSQQPSALRTLKLTGWKTDKITDMSSMFDNCENLTDIEGIPKWNIQNVKTMEDMFKGCASLTKVYLGINAISDVESMRGMFEGCRMLQSVDFMLHENGEASFPKLSTMENMFNGCTVLGEVNMGNLTLPNLTETNKMFYNCTSIRSINLSWKGIKAAAASFNIADMFGNVKPNALLQIGADESENTREIMYKIAREFPGNVNSGGQQLPKPILEQEQIEKIELRPAEALPPEAQQQDPAETEEPGVDVPDGQDVMKPQLPEETETEKQPEQSEQPKPDTTVPQPQPDTAKPTAPEEQPGETEPPAENDKEQPTEETGQPPAAEREENAQKDAALPQDSADTAVNPMRASAGTYRVVSLGMANHNNARMVQLEADAVDGTAERSAADSRAAGLVIHPEKVQEGDIITYKITLKYMGDVGAKSGEIEMWMPIPDKIGKGDDGWKVVSTAIDYSGAATGYKGGRIVQNPYIDENSGHPVLRGKFEGLYTGTQITTSISTKVQKKDQSEYDPAGYAFWDATAYARDNAGSATSQTVRLWSNKTSDTPPNGNEKTISYAFVGEIPQDTKLPDRHLAKPGEQATAAAEPTTTKQGYTFKGWTRSDDGLVVNPGAGFTMPQNDVVLTGEWTLDEAHKQRITVKYQYGGTPPAGVPQLPQEMQVKVGDVHYIQKISQDVDYHKFGGWKPELYENGRQIAMTSTDGGKNYTGGSYTINMEDGALQTNQFHDKTNVVVTFTGEWVPYMGTIHFDANGGRGNMNNMTDVTYYSKKTLPENKFTYPLRGMEFVGWSSTNAGSVIKADQAVADQLIKKDGETVTLYAVWKRPVYGVGYRLTNVNSSSSIAEVNRGASYETTLTPLSDHEMYKVRISMAGRDITDSCYTASTGKVHIPNVDGDVLVYASAKKPGTPDYTLHYESNGGTAFADESYIKDELVIIDKLPTKSGNDFTGWYTEPSLKNRVDSVRMTNNITLYAGWTPSRGGSGDSVIPDGDLVVLHYESNGGTEYSDEKYLKNTEVKLTKNPVRLGYYFTGWFSDKGLTKQISKVMLTQNTTVYAGWEQAEVPFILNDKDHFAYVKGFTDGTMRPSANISRAQVATMLYRLLNDDVRTKYETTANTFSDVNEDMWYNTAISTLAKIGVVKGRSTDHFDPNTPITRAEFAAICARLSQHNASSSNFTDIKGHWAEQEIQTAAALGWIIGYDDGSFRPNAFITRAEGMMMTNRVLNRVPKSVEDLHEDMKVWPDNASGAWYYITVQEASNSHDYERDQNNLEYWTKLIEDPEWIRR